MSDDPNNHATYGRKHTDGSVTGTTSGGSRYTSRDGGGSISVTNSKTGKKRTYTKNRRGGYSLKV